MKKMEKYTKRRLEIDTLLAYGESKELRRVYMRVCYPQGSRARLKLISSFRHPTPILALPSIRYPLHDRRRERKGHTNYFTIFFADYYHASAVHQAFSRIQKHVTRPPFSIFFFPIHRQSPQQIIPNCYQISVSLSSGNILPLVMFIQCRPS